MRIPIAPIFILIISLLSASVIGIDASVGMFVFLIIAYKPVCFVVSKIMSNFSPKETHNSRRKNTKEFIREIDESGDHYE